MAEFYSGCYQIDIKYGDTVSMGVILPHSSAVFKIQEYDPAMPFIVKSTAHYSIGGETEVLKIEKETLIFEMQHLLKRKVYIMCFFLKDMKQRTIIVRLRYMSAKQGEL